MVGRILSSAFAIVAATVGVAHAQVGRVPAEVPPATYTETQYVDSNGCVFIRAGFNGNVTWVPRYGDDRQPMCGFSPSLAGAPAPAQPMVTAATTMAEAPAATTMAPAPEPVTVRAEATTPVRRTTRTASSAGSTRSRGYAPAQMASVPVPREMVYQAQSGPLERRWSFADVTGPSPCTNYSDHSQMYLVPSPTMPELPLRCGPQALHPADALREQSPDGGRWRPWDGSNPYPAPDNNVHMLPGPYAPRWNNGDIRAPRFYDGASYQAPAQQAPRATVSTMGTTRSADLPRAAATGGQMSNGQYVQIGTYGQRSNAQAAIARLQARGMPAAISRGAQNQIVLAGPFRNASELNAALSTLRSMGYSDAFIR
ncbi:MAG: SPOR domain-containing protein [Paracoccaceae bacterium]